MAGEEKLGEDVGSHAAGSTRINLSETQGWTPLHWVCRNGDVDTVKLLINSEADLQSMRSWTPLDVAIFCGNNSLISTLS
jgi:ankyrin repeat protein